MQRITCVNDDIKTVKYHDYMLYIVQCGTEALSHISRVDWPGGVANCDVRPNRVQHQKNFL